MFNIIEEIQSHIMDYVICYDYWENIQITFFEKLIIDDNQKDKTIMWTWYRLKISNIFTIFKIR